jgi:AcrR family transcriptional regulator
MKKEVVDKKEAIFNATIKLLTENGFDGTPMSLIAKEAGVAAGTIYLYFKNKEELINRLYLELKERLTAAVVNGYDRNLPIRIAVELLWENYVSYFTQNPTEYRFFEQFSNSPLINKLTKEEGLKIFSPILEVFLKAKEEKVIKDIPTEIIYCQVFQSVSYLIKQHINGVFELNQENMKTAFQASWDAIKS